MGHFEPYLPLNLCFARVVYSLICSATTQLLDILVRQLAQFFRKNPFPVLDYGCGEITF